MKYRVILFVLGFSLTCSLSAPAALTWESKDADLHPSLADKTAVAHFKYKNTGDKPVKITSVHASCGCTTAALKKDVVDPKESGEITATFNIGGRSGVQTKTITVMTDDQPEQPIILTLKATIPQLLAVQPIFLFWSANDELKPKTINVEVGKDSGGKEFPVTKLNVTSTDKSISTEVKPDADKKGFKIIVKPTEAGRPINAALRIEPDYPKGSAKPYFANLRIDSRAVMPK